MLGISVVLGCWCLELKVCTMQKKAALGFTPGEYRRLRALKTPAGVQRFLDDLPFPR
jgi:hypothetical protein